MDRRLTGGDQEKPLEDVGDAPRPVFRVGLLHRHHLPAHLGGHGGYTAGMRPRGQPIDASLPVGGDPTLDRMLADAELFADQPGAVPLLQEQLDDPQAELDGVGAGPEATLPPRGSLLLFGWHGFHSFLCNWFLHSGVSPHFFNSAVPLTGD